MNPLVMDVLVCLSNLILYLSLGIQVPPQKVLGPSKPTPVPPSQRVRLDP